MTLDVYFPTVRTVDPDDVYALTRVGTAEISSSATSLTTQEIALLLRFDGSVTTRQVRAGLTAQEDQSFANTFRNLRDRGLLHQVELDPLALQMQDDLRSLGGQIAAGEADAGLASLRRTGFYVQIARTRAAAPPQRSRDRLLSVVLVEDDEMLAHFTRTYLSLSGFEVRIAGNRAEVVAEIRKPPLPDLILLDVMLPDVDGFEILLRLRQHPVLQAVPVIMLTGKATREAVIKGIAGGADGYITKPFDPDALTRAVATVLGLPEDRFRQGAKADGWVNHDALPGRPPR